MKQLLTFLFCAVISSSIAQTEINVLCYNVLNFPQGEMQNREDTLRKIFNYTQPDLILLQELKSETGLNSIVEVSCADLDGEYVSSTWVSQQSNQNSDWLLQQAIVYNNEVFGLAEERLKTTPVRDINIYKLFLRDEGLSQGADTTFMYVFNTHLKSSSGSDNEQLRLEMAEVFVNALTEIDPASLCIFGGDFNLYGSDEPAYELLLSGTNSIVFQDPIDAPGSWTSSSYPFKEILTQSTRTSSIFGDGAGGGLDDRFDFILASENVMDPSSVLHYQEDSYLSLGNNGTCYNQNILDCEEDNPVPYDILRAMYYMSDHLPIIMKLETSVVLNTSNEPSFNPAIRMYSDGYQLYLRAENSVVKYTVELIDISGKLVHTALISDNESLDLGQFPNGIYIARALWNGQLEQVGKISVRH